MGVADKASAGNGRIRALEAAMSWQQAVERGVHALGYEMVDAERSAGGLLRVFIDRVAGGSYETRSGERHRPRGVHPHADERARVRTETDERGMPQRHLARVAEEQPESHNDDDVQPDVREHLEEEHVCNGEGHERDEECRDERDDDPERSASHHTFSLPEPPNNP